MEIFVITGGQQQQMEAASLGILINAINGMGGGQDRGVGVLLSQSGPAGEGARKGFNGDGVQAGCAEARDGPVGGGRRQQEADQPKVVQ